MKKLLECEQRSLSKFKLLPYSYKIVGFIAAGLSIVSFIAIALLDIDNMVNTITWSVLLMAMLLISVSREKEEDEYTLSLRNKSYMMAFIAGVLFAVIQPYINFGVSSVVDGNEATFSEMPSYVIVWYMLFVQLGFYYLLRAVR